jgi:hypothetical protein
MAAGLRNPCRHARISRGSRRRSSRSVLADRPVRYPIEAPASINLTSQYNQIAYAHSTARAMRDGKPILAHAWIKIELR